jgi:hypothetical protein
LGFSREVGGEVRTRRGRGGGCERRARRKRRRKRRKRGTYSRVDVSLEIAFDAVRNAALGVAKDASIG